MLKKICLQIKTGVIIENENGDILLIKEKVKKRNRPLWNIIKGTYENHKETVFESAIRECKEESSVLSYQLSISGCRPRRHQLLVNRAQFLKIFILDASYIQTQWAVYCLSCSLICFTANILSGIPAISEYRQQKANGEDIQEVRWFSRKDLSQIRPKQFISSKIFNIIRDWQYGMSYPLEVFKT